MVGRLQRERERELRHVEQNHADHPPCVQPTEPEQSDVRQWLAEETDERATELEVLEDDVGVRER